MLAIYVIAVSIALVAVHCSSASVLQRDEGHWPFHIEKSTSDDRSSVSSAVRRRQNLESARQFSVVASSVRADPFGERLARQQNRRKRRPMATSSGDLNGAGASVVDAIKPAASLGDKIDLGPTTALFLVDLQPLWYSEATSEVRKHFPDLPANIARLLNHARHKNAHVVHVIADYDKQKCPWQGQFAKLNPNRRSYDTDPTRIEEFARPVGLERIVKKHTFGAFQQEPELPDQLRKQGIDTILCCGLVTSVCVHHTAFGAFNHGFRVAVVHDCCADHNLDRHEQSLKLYGGYMYPLVHSQELLNETPSKQVQLCGDIDKLRAARTRCNDAVKQSSMQRLHIVLLVSFALLWFCGHAFLANALRDGGS